MAVSYAVVADLEARWRPLSASEKSVAEVLLSDASALIRSAAPDVDFRLGSEPPLLEEDVPRMVACAMVKRAMLVSAAGAEGVSSQMNVAGPFTQQKSFSNPSGNLYLTKTEKRMLGASTQRAFSVETGPSGDVPGLPLNWWELNL